MRKDSLPARSAGRVDFKTTLCAEPMYRHQIDDVCLGDFETCRKFEKESALVHGFYSRVPQYRLPVSAGQAPFLGHESRQNGLRQMASSCGVAKLSWPAQAVNMPLRSPKAWAVPMRRSGK